ncbi:MAG: serine/threonine protein kinase [Granulosicoccaceae bacterium]
MDNATLAFQHLDPVQILDAIDARGWQTDGRVSALNSYENRVYQIGLQDGSNVIAKFYRPERWTDAAILEEHRFCQLLVEYDLPVIAPIAGENGNTLLEAGPYRFCLFPRAGGRPPELDNPEQLTVIGRTLARLHSAGEQTSFEHRPTINPARLGDESIALLRNSNLVPSTSHENYFSLVDHIMPIVHERFNSASACRQICIHGDFHPGNILWGQSNTPHLLDFDDAATGPAVQDIWMFISGDRAYAQARLGDILDGYYEFREFDEQELSLIEPLRALRIIHYAAWIAKRWEDPAFKIAFPFFADARFWDEHVLSLREQFAALEEKPLVY